LVHVHCDQGFQSFPKTHAHCDQSSKVILKHTYTVINLPKLS
jgi:hypothetical protein